MDSDLAENGEGPASKQGKKLLISDEYFQRVTRALVMRLRQHEETVLQEGTMCPIISSKSMPTFNIHCSEL